MTGSSAERIAALEAEVAGLKAALADDRRRAAEQLRSVADAMPVMISFVDHELRFRFVNRAYEALFERPMAAIVGRELTELVSPATYAARRPFIERALAGEPVSYDADLRRSDGERRLRIHHIPAFADGVVRGFYTMVQDTTEQWRALIELSESEARFRRIADSAPVLIWVTAPDRSREFVNTAYAEFVGVGGGDARQLDWRRILHPDDQARVLAESMAGEASGRLFSLEARFRRADGEYRWLRSTSQPRFADDGMPEGFIGVAQDVTDKHEAAELAHRHATMLSQRVDRRTRERDRLWDLSQDPIAVADRAGVWHSVSPAFTALLGWTAEDLIGRAPDWLDHPDDAETHAELRRLTAAGETVRSVAVRLRGADGGYRWLSWNAVPDGELVWWTARDVTRERDQADALHQAEEALRQGQKMEALGQLTGGVAHDFNNLLTPILGTLDLLSRRDTDERSRRLIDGALQSAGRARTLVQRLLAFARRQPLEAKPVALAGMVHGMADLLQSSLGGTVELALDLDEDAPAALVDQNQVEMALLNLAVNARDAMPDGGRFTVALSTREVGEGLPVPPGHYVALAARDTGTGMDAETLRRATEPFFSTKAQGAGTGLGLSMIHGLAGQLGGTLTIESAPGEGTAVELLLPATEAAPAMAAAPATTGAASMRILLVDDDRLVRAATAAMLADMFHEVIDCGSGREALRLLDQGLDPDLLVTDQVMPEMSGTQLLEQVRRRRPAMKALIISGYPQGDTGRRLPAARLAKPFRRDELARALSSLAS